MYKALVLAPSQRLFPLVSDHLDRKLGSIILICQKRKETHNFSEVLDKGHVSPQG